MDFILASAIAGIKVLWMIISYDIACQWKINFHKRSADFPEDYKSHLENLNLDFGIPKFHLPAHGVKCWSLFSLNFLRGWARTDGEEIERCWAATNGRTASETRAAVRFIEELT